MRRRFWRTTGSAMLPSALLFTFLTAPLSSQQAAQDIDDLTILSRRASRLVRIGNFVEAIPVSQRVLVLAERQLPPNHPNLGIALDSLAYLYLAQSRYAEAEPLYRRLLSIYESVPGYDDGQVWTVLTRLAIVCRALGRETEAEVLTTRARSIEDKISVPFNVYISPAEIITLDLKRMRLTDCGTLLFEVKDFDQFLTFVGGVERAQSDLPLFIMSAFRRVLGDKTSTQIREQTDAVTREIKQSIETQVDYMGVFVREIKTDLRTCVAPIRSE
jgi:tetratricopeptide (TPR) repeat protein